MDEKLIPYFENINDGTAQAQYLEAFGSKEVQGGICLNLVLAWIYSYRKNATMAPNLIWNEIKRPLTLKQIANNQQAYMTNKDLSDVNKCINLYHMNVNTVIDFKMADDICFYVRASLQHSNTLLVVIDLADRSSGKNVAAHAIGVIEHNNRIYMFDPNEGVLTTPVAQLNELLGLVKYIYEDKYKYTICGRNITVIQ